MRIIEITNLSDFIYDLLSNISYISYIGREEFKAIFAGLVEVTNGCRQLSQIKLSKELIIIISSVISFGGFSVHMQSISFSSKAGISTKLYLLGKLTQAFIAANIAYFLLKIISF
jgi:hypothetical protein